MRSVWGWQLPMVGRSFAGPRSVLHEEAQYDAPCHSGGNLAGHIGSYRVHQQVVLVVLGNPHLFNDPGGHGERRNASRADHGIDLLLAEQVQQLGKQHAANAVEHKGEQPQAHNHQSLHRDEAVSPHGERNGQAQQEGDEVGQVVLGGFREPVEHAALPNQVAEHQKAHQRNRGRGH